MSNAFLSELKVGSQVMLSSMGGKIFPHITGETNKYWIIGQNRYRKSDGKKVGGGLTSYLQEFDREIQIAQCQERLDQKERTELRKELTDRIRNADLDTLRSMMNILMSSAK